jgi:hypothetical protein
MAKNTNTSEITMNQPEVEEDVVSGGSAPTPMLEEVEVHTRTSSPVVPDSLDGVNHGTALTMGSSSDDEKEDDGDDQVTDLVPLQSPRDRFADRTMQKASYYSKKIIFRDLQDSVDPNNGHFSKSRPRSVDIASRFDHELSQDSNISRGNFATTLPMVRDHLKVAALVEEARQSIASAHDPFGTTASNGLFILPECGPLGSVWRFLFRQYSQITMDNVNALGWNRVSAMDSLSFVTGHEALLLCRLLTALDTVDDLSNIITAALRSRNVSNVE